MSKRKNNNVLSGGAPEGSMAAGWGGERADIMRDEFGLEIPVENVPLPSKGRVYPPDHPLHMQETVQIRSMTAREEDILTSKALIKKGTVITELIRSCLIDKRIDPKIQTPNSMAEFPIQSTQWAIGAGKTNPKRADGTATNAKMGAANKFAMGEIGAQC